MDNLTLAAILTAAGAVSAALLVRQTVELLKAVFPKLDATVSGALQSFVLTGVLYVAAFVTVGDHTPEGVFVTFLAWLSCASSAVGINAVWDHAHPSSG
jgi:hypothetical protein